MTGEKAIRILETGSCYECTWGCESPTKCTCPKCNLKSAIKVAIEALEEKRPHGEWIYDVFDENYHCSECGKACGSPYDFCPNCGSDNRGEGGEK